MKWYNLQENISFPLGLHLFRSIIFPMYKTNIVLIIVMFFFSCAKNKIIDSSGASINIGTDSTLDILTWNIQNFPKHNSTINYLLELIPIMSPDIITLQEIENETVFNTKLSRPNFI